MHFGLFLLEEFVQEACLAPYFTPKTKNRLSYELAFPGL